MELSQIRYFLALCDTLNFMRAAERCRVSQPSLTRAVQKLERELGGLLIRRERRRTHLTELGHLVRPMLKEVLVQAERTRALAERHRKSARQAVKLGFLPSIGLRRFAPLLAAFSREHPGIELQLVEAALPALYDLLLGGALDAAMVAYGARTEKALRYFQLYKERLVCAIPRGHPFEQLDAVRLRDLKGQDFLARTNCENGQMLIDTCCRQGFDLRVAYRSAREDWVQAMVAAGCGITIIPEFLQGDAGVVLKPVIEPALYRELFLVTVAGRPHTSVITWLLRALRGRKWKGDAALRGARDARKLPGSIRILTIPDGNTAGLSN